MKFYTIYSDTSAKMKFYTIYNGDTSAKIYVFAENKKDAKKMAKLKIKEEELEDTFPVLDIYECDIKEGVLMVEKSTIEQLSIFCNFK